MACSICSECCNDMLALRITPVTTDSWQLTGLRGERMDAFSKYVKLTKLSCQQEKVMKRPLNGMRRLLLKIW